MGLGPRKHNRWEDFDFVQPDGTRGPRLCHDIHARTKSDIVNKDIAGLKYDLVCSYCLVKKAKTAKNALSSNNISAIQHQLVSKSKHFRAYDHRKRLFLRKNTSLMKRSHL